MSDVIPKEFIGNLPVSVRLAGENYLVSPIMMWQIHQLKQVFRSLPRPEPVVVEVEGLVRAMLQPEGVAEHANPTDRIVHRIGSAAEARRDIREIVLLAVREARGRIEQWPPDPISPLGQELIATDETVQQEFLRIVLKKHHPDLTAEDIEGLVENVEVTEYEDLMDAVFNPIRHRQQRILQEQLDDPKLEEKIQKAKRLHELAGNGSGGDGAGFLNQT